jgi:hypothetical protein
LNRFRRPFRLYRILVMTLVRTNDSRSVHYKNYFCSVRLNGPPWCRPNAVHTLCQDTSELSVGADTLPPSAAGVQAGVYLKPSADLWNKVQTAKGNNEEAITSAPFWSFFMVLSGLNICPPQTRANSSATSPLLASSTSTAASRSCCSTRNTRARYSWVQAPRSSA